VVTTVRETEHPIRATFPTARAVTIVGYRPTRRPTHRTKESLVSTQIPAPPMTSQDRRESPWGTGLTVAPHFPIWPLLITALDAAIFWAWVTYRREGP